MTASESFKSRTGVFARFAVTITLGAMLAACSEAQTETAHDVVRPVKVVEIGAADETRVLDYSGAVTARVEADLGFRVAGKIVERAVDVGDRVKPGDLLARIDATDYALSVKTAEANLTAAEKQLETATLTQKRAEQLTARKVASQATLDDATLGYQQALASRDAAAAALQQAENQVGYADLRSEQSGIVTAIGADSGQVVAVGTPVVSVAVDGGKEIEIAVPESDILHFKPDMDVAVGLWTDDKLKLQGKVREIAGSADPRSRTFAVRVSLPDDPRVLLGMTASVTATVGTDKPMISIPLEALAEKDGKQIVWTADRVRSTVHARAVEVADFGPDGVLIRSGLAPRDLVVAAGTQFMEENLQVKLPPEVDAASIEATKTIR
jgi:multidrug efflux system membrane fusion protein